MPVTFDIMDNEVLGPVLRDGIAQGTAQGIVQGSRQIVRSMLEKRFGPLPAWVENRLAACSAAEADHLALRLLEGKSLEELFR